MSERVQIASIRSEGNPQSGQKHRSSGNFSTDDSPDGYNAFEWQVSETEQPQNVKFSVKEDQTAGSDKTVWSKLGDGSSTDVKKERRLYIADPSGSNNGSFLVTVFAAR